MATFALARIVPFQNGNRRAGQLMAHGLLNRAGVPFTGVTTAMQRDRRGLELALRMALDHDDAILWCRAVATAVTDVVMTAPDAMATLDRRAAGLAADMPAFRARFSLSRHDIALDLLTRAVDTPRAFATRHGLSRDAATRILKHLRHRGWLVVERLNGRQTIRLHRAQGCGG
jgi:Fic family protein